MVVRWWLVTRSGRCIDLVVDLPPADGTQTFISRGNRAGFLVAEQGPRFPEPLSLAQPSNPQGSAACGDALADSDSPVPRVAGAGAV